MTNVNIHDAKTHLSRLLDQVIHGGTFVIAKAGKPLVKVTSVVAPREPRRLGFGRDGIGARRFRHNGCRGNRANV
jgi:prevent-host-death family protein